MNADPQHSHPDAGKSCCAHHGAEPTPVARPAPASGATYTCPMHPQIRQQGPGNCPICGMALEPMAPHEVPEDDAPLRSVRRKFWIAVVLCVPLLAVAMLPELSGWKTTAMSAWSLRVAQIVLS